MADARVPDMLHAYDGERQHYLHGHGADLGVVDDPSLLESEPVWMRPIPASAAADYGVPDDDCDDTVLRNPTTGRFEARIIWIECSKREGAEPFLAVRYRRAA